MCLIDRFYEFISKYTSCAINHIPIDFMNLLGGYPFIVSSMEIEGKTCCSLRFYCGEFAGWSMQFYGARGLDFSGLNLNFDAVIDFDTLCNEIQDDIHSNELCECDLQEVL